MFKVGLGFDVHKFCENKKLILAGIYIPYKYGLLAHSDGDVVLHSISDALLGCLAKGDIGQIFPDNKLENKDIDSSIILKKAYQIVLDENYTLNNLDLTIVCEKPKISPFSQSMRENLANLLSTNIANISIKATTMEKLDAIGQGLGISCTSIVSIIKKDHE